MRFERRKFSPSSAAAAAAFTPLGARTSAFPLRRKIFDVVRSRAGPPGEEELHIGVFVVWVDGVAYQRVAARVLYVDFSRLYILARILSLSLRRYFACRIIDGRLIENGEMWTVAKAMNFVELWNFN